MLTHIFLYALIYTYCDLNTFYKQLESQNTIGSIPN
jgi:hypothetical protein